MRNDARLSWHHTNTDMLFHLPVTKVFRELRFSGKSPFNHGPAGPNPDPGKTFPVEGTM